MKLLFNIDNRLAKHLIDARDGVTAVLHEHVLSGKLLPRLAICGLASSRELH